MLFFMVCLLPVTSAEAKTSAFRQCGRETKTGKYYIWSDNSSRYLYAATSKSGNGSVLTEASDGRRIAYMQISDGFTVYYVEVEDSGQNGNNTGYVYRIKVDGSGKKQIGVMKNVSGITTYYKGNLYLSGHDGYSPMDIHTYRMNVKNGAAKRVMKNACVREQKGQYLLARPNGGAPCPVAYYVYNCKTGKATRITKKGEAACFFRNKIYYAECIGDPHNSSTFRIRRCSLSGKGKKTLVNKIKAAYIESLTLTSKYAYYACYDSKRNKTIYYRYNLKTKKKAKISHEKFNFIFKKVLFSVVQVSGIIEVVDPGK